MKRAVFLLLLAGCVGPGYQPKPVATPNAWTFRDAAAMRVDAAPDAQWWASFDDPILDALIRDAAVANHDIRIAAERVRESRAQRGIVASRGLPQVDANATLAQARRSDAIPSLTPRDAQLYEAGFDARWELDLWGGIRRDVEAAIALVEADDELRRDTVRVVVAEVGRNYVEVRGTQSRLASLDARIATMRDILAIVRERRDAGLTNDLDVARTESLLAESEALRPQLQFAIASAEARIATLLDAEVAGIHARLGEPRELKTTPAVPLPIGAPEILLARRPDIRRAERILAAQTARIGVARAQLFPTITLGASAGHRSSDIHDFTTASSRFASIGPVVRWPLLTGGRVRQQIEAQRARRDQAQLAYEQTVRVALEDVERALAAYTRDRGEEERLGSAEASLRRSVTLAEHRYRAGLDNFLPVLDAQRSLRDVEERRAAAKTRVAVSVIGVYKALGGS